LIKGGFSQMNWGKIYYYFTISIVFLGISNNGFSLNPNRSILYINSYQNGYYWSDGITNGIKTTLQDFPEINLFIEYLDAKNDTSFYKDPSFFQLFSHKYSNKKIDLIITSDNDALDFVKQNQPFFRNIPIVACGISDPDNYSELSGLYVVKEITSFEETFDLMNSFIPGLDTIFFITDRLRSGLLFEEETREIVDRKFPKIILSFIDCFELSTLGNIINKIDYPSAIFYSTASVDCKGKPINGLKVAKEIVLNAKAPLFSGYYATVTDGFIGGCLTTGAQMGKISTDIALKLLFDKDKGAIKRIIIPEVISIFDYRNLKKFNIPNSKIPAGSKILNKPLSIWEKNKKVLIICGIIIFQLLIVIFFLFRTIFIQKKLRKQILLAMEKANESDRLKSIFLENVSHEMRTPLNSIVGFSDVVAEMMEDSKLKEYVHIILENALSLNHMITHIFDFSLLKSQSVDIYPVKVNLMILLSNVIEAVKIEKKFNNKQIEIILDPDPNHPDIEIISDEKKIFEVIKQLVDNALKYTSQGNIRMGFRFQKNNELMVPTEILRILKPPYVLFYVIDTGKGIKPEYLKLVFEPFRQADERHIDANRGIGLGLSICKSIVEILGGQIWVFSQLNQGSSFYFTIPFDTDHFVDKRTKIGGIKMN
jgi:two-component system, sensor histidine kinase